MDKGLLSKDTIIKTNLITVIMVISIIVGGFVSYTVAVNRIANSEKSIQGLDMRVQKLEDANAETQKLLIQISTDVRYIKENPKR